MWWECIIIATFTTCSNICRYNHKIDTLEKYNDLMTKKCIIKDILVQ